MKNAMKKTLAMLTVLMMVLNCVPSAALAIASDAFSVTLTPKDAHQTAFEVVQDAIDANKEMPIPLLQVSAEVLDTAPVATGEFFQYKISYSAQSSPTYIDDSTDSPAQAYDQYEDVTFSVVAPANIALYDADGLTLLAHPGETYTYVLPNSIFSYAGDFTLVGRMIDNGSSPSGTAYGTLGLSMSATVNVTDVNLSESREMVFTSDKIPADATATVVTNKADTAWSSRKTAGTATVVGDTVVATYEIEVGKVVNGAISRLSADYDKTGILNFSSFTLTDSLPTFTGASGAVVKPLSAAITPLSADGTALTALTATSGADETQLSISYYNTIAATGKAAEAGDTPFNTRYSVSVTYPRSEFVLNYGDSRIDDGTTFALLNAETAAWRFPGDTEDRTDTKSDTVSFQIATKAGAIRVEQDLKLLTGGQETVEYNALYHLIFGGAGEFKIYAAADFDEATGAPKAGAAALDTLEITNVTDTSIDLAPGDYYILRTGSPDSTVPADAMWQKATVTSEGVAEVTFLNRVEGKGLLRFHKVDNDGYDLGGAVFTLLDASGAATAYTATTSDVDGMAYLLAPAGTYTLRESTVPVGYLPAADQIVTLVESQTTDLAQDIVDYSVDVAVRISKYAVLYSRSDLNYGDDEKWPIAEKGDVDSFAFTLYRSLKADFPDDETDNLGTYHVSADDSTVTIKNLLRTDDAQNYYYYKLVETSSDSAFTPVSDQYVWQFSDLSRSTEARSFYNRLSSTLTLAKQQTTLVDGSLEPATVPAPGKSFDLYRKGSDGTFTLVGGPLTTLADGTATSAALPVFDDATGAAIDYYLVEQADAAFTPVYPATETITVGGTSVSAWGPIHLAAQKATDLTETPVTNEQNKAQLKITKTDSSGTVMLSGAKFKVYTLSGTDRTYLGGGEAYTTDDNGELLITGLDISAAGITYYVEETGAPDGYRLSGDTQTVTMTAPLQQGSLTFSNKAKPQLSLAKSLVDPVTGKAVADSAQVTRSFTFELYQLNAQSGAMDKVAGADAITVDNAATVTTLVEAEGVYYLRETAHPSDTLDPAIAHEDGTGVTVDGVYYYGPYTLTDDSVTQVAIKNYQNNGSLTVVKSSAKVPDHKLSGAKYALSIQTEDKATQDRLLAKGFKASGSTYTLTLTTSGSKGSATCTDLPVYDSLGTALNYSLVETEAPTNFLLPEDNTPRTISLASAASFTDEQAYSNPPSFALTITKYMQKRWDEQTGHMISYPMKDVQLGLYVVENGTLTYLRSLSTDSAGLATFSALDGTKEYAIFELACPAGYDLPDGKTLPATPLALNGMTLAVAKALYNGQSCDLATKEGYALTLSGSDAVLNWKPYTQFELTKTDAVTGAPLDHAKFIMYSCTAEDYAAYGTIEALQAAGKLTISDYVYETGTAAPGVFLSTEQTYGDVYWFQESEVPAGYSLVGTGLIGPLTAADCVKNGITKLSATNEPGTGAGGGIRYFQVELNKTLYSKAGVLMGNLANVTFQVYLADADYNAVQMLNYFTTGLDTDKDPYGAYAGRGISASIELSALSAKYPELVKKTYNEQTQTYRYELNLLLRESAYPMDVTPVQTDYPLHIDTDVYAAGNIVDKTYTGDNSIRNVYTKEVPVRIRKLGYSVSDTAHASTVPLSGVTIGIYDNALCSGTPVMQVVTDQYGYANMTLTPNKHYWYKELRTCDGYELSGTIGTFLTGNYGSDTATYFLEDAQYRALTLVKKDAAGAELTGVVLRLTGKDGAQIKDANGQAITADTITTGTAATISLPNGSYYVEEISVGGEAVSAVDASYFKLINASAFPITFGGTESAKTVTLSNPGKASLTVTKVDDAGATMAGVSFAVAFKPFETLTELASDTTADTGFTDLNETWTTDGNGQIVKTGLTPGWYKLTETVPEGYVGYQVDSPVTIIKATAVHLGQSAPATVTKTLTNTRKGYLTIEKTFEQSALYTIPQTLTFSIYTDEDCQNSASPAQVVVTLNGGTGSAQVALDPGVYYVKEEASTAWYGKCSLTEMGAKTAEGAWVNGAIRVNVTSGDVAASPVLLTVENVPSAAAVTLLKTDDTDALLMDAGFAIYYMDGETKLYYQPDDTWTAARDTAKCWDTDQRGLTTVQVRLPFDRLLADEGSNTYWITELHAPHGLALAEDFSVTLGTGSIVDRTDTPIIDATGLYIDLTKYGRTHDNAPTDADLLDGAGFTLYALNTVTHAYRAATTLTTVQGKLRFINLEKLDGDWVYAIAETTTPATHVEGSLAVYLNDTAVTPVTVDNLTLFPVTQRDTVSVAAYNTPKGHLAILKYNYLEPTSERDVPLMAVFNVYKLEGGVETLLTPNGAVVAQAAATDPDTLSGGLYRKGTTYYVGQSGDVNGTIFSDAIVRYLEPGTYVVREVSAAQGFYFTPQASAADPWYMERTVTIGEDGETTVCAFANVPNPDIPKIGLTKRVTALNGDAAATTLSSLQGIWQTITYSIGSITSANGLDHIELPLKWHELRDTDLTFLSKSGAATTAEHWVNALTIGQVHYSATRLSPIASTEAILAAVYGVNGDTSTLLEVLDVSAAARTVTFTGNYEGFRIVYGVNSSAEPVGLHEGFTAGDVQVEFRMRQEDDPSVLAATQIVNEAKARIEYSIGTSQSISTAWVDADCTAAIDAEDDLPRAKLEKAVTNKTRPSASEFVQAGDVLTYKVTMTNVSTDKSIQDPVLLDMMPSLVDYSITDVTPATTSATLTLGLVKQQGSTLSCAATGELKPGETFTLTIQATVRYATILTGQSGNVINRAYALSASVKHHNTDNPYGTSFYDEQGSFPTYPIDGSDFGGSEPTYQALVAQTVNGLQSVNSLKLYKLVSADMSGLSDYMGAERYAMANADGTISYKIILSNGGTTSYTNIRIIDKLPVIGDTSVAGSSKRGSMWDVTLTDVTSDQTGAGISYYVTSTAESGLNYLTSIQKGPAAAGIWDAFGSGNAASAKAVLIDFGSLVLGGGQQIIVTLTCKAPSAAEASANGAYFLMSVNDAVSAANIAASTSTATTLTVSNIVRVALLPKPVSLGNRVWVDKNANGLQDAASGESIDDPASSVSFEHAYTGAGITITLRKFVNSDTAYTTQSMTLGSDGFYRFDDLMTASAKGSAYDATGSIINSNLTGAVKASYQLEVSGIPEGYFVTTPYAAHGGTTPTYENGGERATDSNFTQQGGSILSEKFYLQAGEDFNKTFDLGLVRYRNLTLTKNGTDGRLVDGAVFTVYGPYTNAQLQSLTIADGDAKATLTTVNGAASFTSTSAENCLSHYMNYVVVETSPAQTYYLSDDLAATGANVGAAKDYTGITGSMIHSGNFFVLKAKSEDDTAVTDAVSVTNTYVAEGAMQLTGVKTLLGDTLTDKEFAFELKTVSGTYADADFAQLYKANGGVSVAESDVDGNFTFPAIVYDYADAGKEYEYTLRETNKKQSGITYDSRVYTIHVALADNGDGTLRVTKTMSCAGQNVTAIAFENISRGTLVISKAIGGNAPDKNKAFTFTIALTDKQGRPVTGTFTTSAGELVFDADGKATISLKGGESCAISGLLTGTRFRVTEANYAGDGYVTTPATREVTGSIRVPATPDEAVFTNERSIGSVTVAKAGAGNAVNQDKLFHFTLRFTTAHDIPVAGTYDCDGALSQVTVDQSGAAELDLKAGQSVTIKGLPADATYTVTEDDYLSGAYFVTPSRSQQGTVTVQGTTHTFTNARSTGALTVEKTLAGNAADPDKTFDMEITLSRNDGVDLTGTYPTVTKDGTTGTITFDAALRQTISLKGGESLTIQGIPVDTTYRVTEKDYTADEYDATYLWSDGGNHLMTIAGAQVTIVNTRNTFGALIVSKTVAGNLADETKLFRFTLDLSRTDAMAVDGDYAAVLTDTSVSPAVTENRTVTVTGGTAELLLHHGQSLAIEGILTGTRYTVTEDDYALDGYTTLPDTLERSGVILGQNERYTAAFVNTRNAGGLLVSKTGAGNAVDPDKTFHFTVALDHSVVTIEPSYPCTWIDETVSPAVQTEGTVQVVNGEIALDLQAGHSVLIRELLVGTGFTVTEDDYTQDGYTTLPASRTISGTLAEPDGTVPAAFTNTRNLGSLTVSKVLAGNAADPEQAFDFTLRLTRTDGLPVESSYPCRIDGGTVQTLRVDALGYASITLLGGQTLTIEQILSGTTYQVVESDYAADGYVTTLEGDSGVTTTGTVAAAFTNTRNTASLSITKLLAGNAAEPDRDFNFTVRAAYLGTGLEGSYSLRTDNSGARTITFRNGVARLTLKGDETATIGGLLLGTVYTVTEQEADTEDYTTTKVRSTGTIRAGVANVTFTNERSVAQEYTSLTVLKRWSDQDDHDQVRPGTLTIYLLADGTAITSQQISAATDWQCVFTDLPVYNLDGTTIRYRVVEAASADYYATYSYSAQAVSILNTHAVDPFVPDPRKPGRGTGIVIIDDLNVPLGGNINMNEGDCFN